MSAGTQSREAGHFRLLLLVGVVLIAGLVVLYVGSGSVALSPVQVVAALFNRPEEAFHRQIVWDIRFPRALIALTAGACLGLAGAMLQTTVRNPLAEPALLGVSAGGVLAVVVWLTLAAQDYRTGPLLPVVAAAGGISAGGLVYAFSWEGRTDPLRLVLTGAIVSALIASVSAFLLARDRDVLGNVMFWIIGSLNGRVWVHWSVIWPWAALTIPAGLMTAGLANALSLGDDVARGLGVRVERARIALLLTAVLLTSGAVAVVGAVGFIGLVAPHICRRLVGNDARRLFPSSLLVGAVLLLGADLVARSVARPTELPAGAVTAMLGAPFFIYLLLRREH